MRLLNVVLFCTTLFLFGNTSTAQTVTMLPDTVNKRVDILVDGAPFTSLLYADTMQKPVLYPIYAAGEHLITRGYPLATRPGEPLDHPHHIGLWMNYENVNGIDFWNNSFAIPASRIAGYGTIKTLAVAEAGAGSPPMLSYEAAWQKQSGETLLREHTRLSFSATAQTRVIDRVTTLTALDDVSMPDVKDGFIGLRVAHALELPSKEKRTFSDDKGNSTTVQANSGDVVTGNYLSSEGIRGDAVWGTRARWCMLYGRMGTDSISIVIIDHPGNTGYPTFWHARGYGLFAANPLGQKVFSGGKDSMNFSLKKGDQVTFKYRIVIHAEQQVLERERIEALVKEFEKQ